MKINERPPASLVVFLAQQIDVLPDCVGDYLAAERTCRRHAAEAQDRLGLRPFGPRPAAELANWLLPKAIEDERLVHLAGLHLPVALKPKVVKACRHDHITIASLILTALLEYLERLPRRPAPPPGPAAQASPQSQTLQHLHPDPRAGAA